MRAVLQVLAIATLGWALVAGCSEGSGPTSPPDATPAVLNFGSFMVDRQDFMRVLDGYRQLGTGEDSEWSKICAWVDRLPDAVPTPDPGLPVHQTLYASFWATFMNDLAPFHVKVTPVSDSQRKGDPDVWQKAIDLVRGECNPRYRWSESSDVG